MRLLRATLGLILSYAIGIQPAVAQVQAARVVVPVAPSAVAAGAATSGTASLTPLRLSAAALSTSLSLTPALAAPAALAGQKNLSQAPVASISRALTVPTASALPAAAGQVANAGTKRGTVSAASANAPAANPIVAAASADALSAGPVRIAAVQAAADAAVRGLARSSGSQARDQAARQFAALTGERIAGTGAAESEAPAATSADRATPAPRADAEAARGTAREELPAPAAELGKPDAQAPPQAKAAVPAPAEASPAKKLGIFQVFRDSARNSAFWRYVTGYGIFLVGYEMYIVGLPYLISSMTTNALKERGDARAGDEQAVKELIRSNRSMARIAHWVAQAFSYIAIPLFLKNADKDGPGKWLARSMLIRSALLMGLPVLFFTTGFLGLHAMIGIYALIGIASFFQGITVTTEGASTTRLLGDKSVTSEERTKANSIITVLTAVIAILGPLIAGQIATLKPMFGKEGIGGAVIYGIYAATIGVAGLIYATIRLFKGKGSSDEASAAPVAPKGLGATLKGLWTSIKDGTKIVLKDRLLRTMLLLSMISSLFNDPLIFNVLPEYIEALVAQGSGTLGTVFAIPGIGWFLKTLVATPMGNFALMIAMSSIGSIIATLLMKPLTKLFQKFGFKTDEALTIPFYFIAALEAPLLILMIHTPGILAAVALYGLQALSIGFIGIHIQGLFQKNLGSKNEGDVNKILAAESLIGIIAAIASTFAYGFLLKDIAIGTSLLIAAVATSVMAAIRLAAPFLAFSKEQRRTHKAPSTPK